MPTKYRVAHKVIDKTGTVVCWHTVEVDCGPIRIPATDMTSLKAAKWVAEDHHAWVLDDWGRIVD